MAYQKQALRAFPFNFMRALLVLLFLFLLAGCLSPITLNRAVMIYDEAVISAESKQLLANIVRAQYHEPIHFTRVSNIAATFDFRFNAGATPALTGDAGRAILPTFGGSVAENPTFSIAPIGEEEFTKRLLMPFHQNKIALLLRQHFEVDLMLRMMAQEVHLVHQAPLENPVNRVTGSTEQRGGSHTWHDRNHPHEVVKQSGEDALDILQPDALQERSRLRRQRQRKIKIYHNSPSRKSEYEMFRRVVLHLATIQDQNKLHVEPLTIERSWVIPANSVSAEGFQSLQKEFTVRYNQNNDTFTVSKQVAGPVLITNYNPEILSYEERTALYELTSPLIDNDIAFDIRPEYAGGEWPMNGSFRLRSFHSIVTFLSHALSQEEPEYLVEKDPRTPSLAENKNPAQTLEIIISDSPPKDVELSVKTHGKFYAINGNGPNAHWNLNAFQLLHILFRMTVTDAPTFGVPSITIAK